MSAVDVMAVVDYAASFGLMVLIQAVACLGLNLQWGQTGLFNVGVAGIMALGAYTTAILTSTAAPVLAGAGHWPILAGMVAAAGVAGIASALLGLLTLRLRADYLAITTFGVAVVIDLVIRNADRLTGGPLGLSFIPRPFDGFHFSAPMTLRLSFVWVAVVVALTYLLLERLVTSPWGRVLRALREDERAAAALGKPAHRYRLQAFALGGALMGLAGALEAHTLGFIAPDNFTSALTFQLWAMLIVGGSGNNRGVLLGAGLVGALWSGTGWLAAALLPADLQARGAALRIVIVGVLLTATILWRPRGLLGEAVTVSRHLDAGTESAEADGLR